MKRGILYIINIAILLFSLGCTDNEIIVEDSRGDTESSSKYGYPIYVHTRIYDNFTAQLNLFPEGAKAAMFAYDGTTYEAWRLYKSNEAGSLSPVTDQMTLFWGTYDFYLVSNKNDSNPPTFNNSTALDLTNGVDYLWASVKNKEVESTINLPMELNHVCSQIVLYVDTVGTDGKIESIKKATMQSPTITTKVYWDLFTGVIAPAVAVDTLIDMTVSGFMCQQVIVPLKLDGNISYNFEVQFTDEPNTESYSFEIPVYESEYEGGSSYQYSIDFSTGTVNVGSVNINNWVIVDEEGNPLEGVTDD